MARATLMLLALLLLVPGRAYAQPSVAGDWDVTINSPQGANTVTVSFKQDGEKVSGLFKSQMGELPFEGGTLTGNDLKFAFTINAQGQAILIAMTGKVEGDTMTGKADFGGFGEGDWTAKRSAAAATSTPSSTPAPAAATPAPSSATAVGAGGKWD